MKNLLTRVDTGIHTLVKHTCMDINVKEEHIKKNGKLTVKEVRDVSSNAQESFKSPSNCCEVPIVNDDSY